jgi:glyoxylase-like metal-dependent hydrolase (beta-lactamase superfamily II)
MTRRGCSFSNGSRIVVALLLLLAGVRGPAFAQQNAQPGQAPGKGKLDVVHVQGNVYMIAGAGANITVQVGKQVVFLVDSGLAQMSDQVLAAIRGITDKRVMFIINTSADADHISGNENISKAGVPVPNIGSTLIAPGGASVVAHYNVLTRISAPSGKESLFPSADWPTDTYETDDWKFYNGEGVFIYHPAHAHTDGDSYVLFRGSDVISVGDILTLASYPVIKAEEGGSINGLIKTLNQIIDMLEPEENEEGGTYVIPGHGHVCDRNDVVDYRDMVTIIRDRVQNMVDKGMTLEQVKAARITLDYDGLFGATTGPWTTDMFIEAIYKELSAGKTPGAQKAGEGR